MNANLFSIQRRLVSSVVCAAALIVFPCLVGHAASFIWTGNGSYDSMSAPENWMDEKTPENLENDFVFDSLVSDARTTVAVDLPGNASSLVFAEGAPAMTLRSSPPNDGGLQFAANGTTLPLSNKSSNSQTFNLSVRQFWIGGGPIRRWETGSGNLEFNGAVILRGDGITAKAVTWELAADGNMNFNAPLVSAENWYPPPAALTVVKTGGGTLTFRKEAQWNGVTSVEEGVLAVDGKLDTTGDVIIETTAALHGSGTIVGPCTVQGTLAPGGLEISKITFAGGLRLSGTTEFGIDPSAKNKSKADLAVVSGGTLVYGGVLRITASASGFVKGQSFKLFEWSDKPPEGTFERLDLPKLPPGLRWRDNLVHDGTISVEM